MSEANPFVRKDDPEASHDAAQIVIEREGGLESVKPGTHRHKMLRIFFDGGAMTVKHAGQRAYDRFGIGIGTEAEEESGRRRCSDLDAMGLIEKVGPRSSKWQLSLTGRSALADLDSGLPVISSSVRLAHKKFDREQLDLLLIRMKQTIASPFLSDVKKLAEFEDYIEDLEEL